MNYYYLNIKGNLQKFQSKKTRKETIQELRGFGVLCTEDTLQIQTIICYGFIKGASK